MAPNTCDLDRLGRNRKARKRSDGVAALRRPFAIIARIPDLVHALNSRLPGAGLKAQGVAVRRMQKIARDHRRPLRQAGEEGAALSAT
jgi:hypothetical protein